MDVRCEKCLTTYEFDDAQVGANGVSVKCTQCGNLFKVKRRETTAEMPLAGALRTPSYVPPASAPRPAQPAQTATRPQPTVTPAPLQKPMAPAARAPQPATPARAPQPAAPTATPQAVPPAAQRAARSTHPGIPVLASPPDPQPAAPAEWTVRLKSNGQTYPVRELTTLQQWIVERKVGRKDELSQGGANWKPLGAMAELEPFFKIVDEASQPHALSPPSPAPSRAPADNDLAFTATARMSPARAYEGGGDDPAFAPTGPKPKVTPPPFSISPSGDGDDLADLDLDGPTRGSRGPLWAFLGILLMALGLGGYAGRDTLKRWLGGGATKADPAYQSGRQHFLLDTDDDFRQAAELLLQAHNADDGNALVTAALAEVNATWAFYLREDARALDGSGPATEAVARRLRKDGQARIDEAKKFAAEALARAPDAPEVNRAMADYQRIDGAPAAEVERYLKRALDKNPSEPEAVFVAGALAMREGRLDEARVKFEQANHLAEATPQHGLLRATFLLAKLDLQTGKRDEGRKLAEQILAFNPQHERARTLLAQSPDAGAAPAAAAPTDVAAANKPGAALAPAGPGATAPAAASTEKKSGDAEELPADYHKLVEKADRLSENGRSDQARKLYERALTVDANGVEAMTGLGYCDLDKERFMAAIDHFKQALGVSPTNGEAIIGIAEAYKVRGDKPHAAEYYHRYLKAQPNGPKASMAQKNLRELEPPVENKPASPGESKPAPAPGDEPPP